MSICDDAWDPENCSYCYDAWLEDIAKSGGYNLIHHLLGTLKNISHQSGSEALLAEKAIEIKRINHIVELDKKEPDNEDD